MLRKLQLDVWQGSKLLWMESVEAPNFVCQRHKVKSWMKLGQRI